MKYFSMFTGVGGFELGIQKSFNNRYLQFDHTQRPKCDHYIENELEQRKCQCVGYSEIDKHACKVMRYRFPEVKNYGDATKINEQELPDFDLLVGGFPCQAFSIAGKRRGFKDTRGTLFFDIARIIKAKQPRMFVLENVKGLLNHNKGETFTTILKTIDELGYDAEWKVFNSKHYGVPQNRERVFIIGYIRGTSPPKVFPQLGTNCEDTGEDKVIHDTLTEAIGRQGSSSEYLRSLLSVSQARLVKSQNLPTQKIRMRRLTPCECERLQGFPDDWTKYGIDEDGTEVEISDTQRYKMMGNAVTVNVVERLVDRMLFGKEDD